MNSTDELFVKRHLGRDGYHDDAFHDDAHVNRTITKILDDASRGHRKVPRWGIQVPAVCPTAPPSWPR